MNWTKERHYYWRNNEKSEWIVVDMEGDKDAIAAIGGEIYGPVPSPDELDNLREAFDKAAKEVVRLLKERPAPETVEQMKHDLEFIAKMLQESVMNRNNKGDFHVCEAWEIAKKYFAEDGIATTKRGGG